MSEARRSYEANEYIPDIWAFHAVSHGSLEEKRPAALELLRQFAVQ